MDGKADLHLHTLYSDGALSPQELLQQAQRAGLAIVSITDHDNTSAVPEALSAGKRMGIDVISGVELSSTLNDQDIHLLGYFIDLKNAPLQSLLGVFREERRHRAERIVERLHRLNLPLPFDAVLTTAGQASIGRPHIATALVEAGFIDSYNEAFARFLGVGRPAYEHKYKIHPRDAIELIAAAGGLSFVAHPGNFMDEGVLLTLIKEGVDGIEVVHPSHSPEKTAFYRGVAEEYFLLTSGGSDFHGGKKNDSDALGRFTVPGEAVELMRRHLR